MIQARKNANLPNLTLNKVQTQLHTIKSIQELTHKGDKVEEMVNEKFNKRMKEGKLGGLNLSFVKIELQSNIGLFKQKLMNETNHQLKQDYLNVIKRKILLRIKLFRTRSQSGQG